MCLIIDACARDRVFCSNPPPEAKAIIHWIEHRDGRIAYGGSKLCNELFGSNAASRTMKAWRRAGKAIQYLDSEVDLESKRVSRLGVARSNDVHILALARICGARTLYSMDETLHADFKNKDLINHPGGNIYQTEEHSHLLVHTPSCRVGQKRAQGEFWTDQ